VGLARKTEASAYITAPYQTPMVSSGIRNRFVLTFFIAGALVPLAIMTVGWLTAGTNGAGSVDGHTRTAHWTFLQLIWPTWILMLDAEHPLDIAFALLFGAFANGVWYAAVGFALWYLGVGLQRLLKPLAGRS
jgi:hypothetical protein